MDQAHFRTPEHGHAPTSDAMTTTYKATLMTTIGYRATTSFAKCSSRYSRGGQRERAMAHSQYMFFERHQDRAKAGVCVQLLEDVLDVLAYG